MCLSGFRASASLHNIFVINGYLLNRSLWMSCVRTDSYYNIQRGKKGCDLGIITEADAEHMRQKHHQAMRVKREEKRLLFRIYVPAATNNSSLKLVTILS